MSPISQKQWTVCPVCKTSYDAENGGCPKCDQPSNGTGKCSRCGQDILPEFRFCDGCGAPLQVVESPGGAGRRRSNRLNPLNLDECPQCHKDVPLSAEVCPGCGKRLDFIRNLFHEPFTGDLILCPRCHRRHGATAVTCEECGTEMLPPLIIPRERNLSSRPSASFGRRLGAGIVDQLVLYALVNIFAMLLGTAWVLWLTLASSMQTGEEMVADNMPLLITSMMLVCILPYAFYFTVFLMRNHGKTIGGRVCRVRVVREDGYGLKTDNVVLRLAGALICLLTFGLGLLVPLLSKDRRSLSDRLSGTKVVEDPLIST